MRPIQRHTPLASYKEVPPLAERITFTRVRLPVKERVDKEVKTCVFCMLLQIQKFNPAIIYEINVV